MSAQYRKALAAFLSIDERDLCSVANNRTLFRLKKQKTDAIIQILTDRARKRRKILEPHFVSFLFEGTKYYVRELGKRSEAYKQLKQKKKEAA